LKLFTQHVLDVERAWAQAGLGATPLPELDTDTRVAAACAIASRFLAVGTPRTIGLVGGEPHLADLCLEAHRAYFAEPRELRRAAQVGVRSACAADIVCVLDDDARIDPSWLRAGTHVNLVRGALVAPPPRAIRIDRAALAQIVCGHRDGRQLDELTIFAPA
jgi:ornithine cyclodeaminase/alanine dehydrogenase-like protein (mu-crystallin family)